MTIDTKALRERLPAFDYEPGQECGYNCGSQMEQATDGEYVLAADAYEQLGAAADRLAALEAELAEAKQKIDDLRAISNVNGDWTLKVSQLEAENQLLREILDCRAGRLLVRAEPFFVVKANEPYAQQVVELIKLHEGERWTAEDEQWAQQALAAGGGT